MLKECDAISSTISPEEASAVGPFVGVANVPSCLHCLEPRDPRKCECVIIPRQDGKHCRRACCKGKKITLHQMTLPKSLPHLVWGV